MSRWFRRPGNPLGTMPKGLVRNVAIVLGAVVGGLVILTTPGSEEPEVGGGEEPVDSGGETESGETYVRSTASAIERLQREARQLAEAREADLAARRAAATASGHLPVRADPRDRSALTGLPGSAGSGDPEPESPEAELREELRLADIRRSHEALRSDPVALSLRAPTDAAETGSAVDEDAPEPPSSASVGVPEAVAPPDELARLEALASRPDGARPVTTEPVEDAPTAVTMPTDPPDWERIFEGQFLEAVLTTELRGDFAGPAVALVSSPLWSRDRQRVLIPRGTRAIGTAEAVGAWQQGRLAVAFHRLVFPDGSYIRLAFAGLDQAGATGLRDRVNRHYLSTIGAAGAVGLISGLTLRGSRPYEGGLQGGQAGAGIGLGRSAEQILDRYLNRLPTITIRAGTRLRIMLTSDALVPRPPFRLQAVARETTP